jgi:Zn ribbon nucleic-acid-binding protein
MMSPSGEEMLVPIQAFACVKCGHINKEFLPKDLPDDEENPLFVV